MIERQFVAQKMKEQQVQEYVTETLSRAGVSHTKIQRTPMGEKIVIFTSHPGLVVGRSGENIKKLTVVLKKKFGLENPQIEISEIDRPDLDPQIVAEKIATSLERFGSAKFKGIMHKAMDDVIRAGAIGVEIVLSGKIPSTRAKSWRIKGGHIKKCGDIAVSYVQRAKVQALIKTGMIGIQVNIMPPGILLPDSIKVLTEEEMEKGVVEVSSESEESSEAVKEIKQKLKEKTKKDPKKSESKPRQKKEKKE